MPYTGPFSFGGVKKHTWSYWSVDNAGNKQKPVKVTALVVQPGITGLSQNSASVGAASFTLTVTGNYFISGAKVYWNNTALTTTYISANQVTAVVPAFLLTKATTASIQLRNRLTYGKTNLVSFTVGS